MSDENLVCMYTKMLEIRRFEERVMELYKDGAIPGVAHLYIGEEAVAVGTCVDLHKDDYIVSNHRSHGHSLAKGMDPRILMAELFGKATGCCRGIGGSMHSTDLRNGILFSTAIVGSGIPIAVGAGLAPKLKKTSQVVVVYFGDGAVNIGSFHESLNLASIWRLPVIFVCENNQYGMGTHVRNATAISDISDRAAAYEIPSFVADGNDVQAVRDSMSRALAKARRGEGPQFIECRTYRLIGHHIREDWRVDVVPYRSKEEIESWKVKDPVKAFKEFLMKEGLLTPKDTEKIGQEVEEKIEEAERFAKDSPVPTLDVATESVYAPEYVPETQEPVKEHNTRIIRFSDAIREALREEMRRDENVFLLGEDIGRYGGIFTATKGLIDEFGSERVRDTPISETAIIGGAIGSALMGLRPVAEIMYMDFLTCAMDQLLNHAPKMSYMTGGQLKLPMVVRTQSSMGRFMGAQHSQFFPAAMMQFPGLKIALPSTPYDAKGLLKTAVRDNNPVLFVEVGQLYTKTGPVPESEYTLSFGKADVKKEGHDVTVVAISNMVHKALDAADELQKERIEIEVLDPRTIVPLDKHGISESVKKTGRLVVAEESCRVNGLGAEIAAFVVEECFDYLDAPISRVAALDTPAPFSPILSDAYVPSKQTIIDAVRKVMK